MPPAFRHSRPRRVGISVLAVLTAGTALLAAATGASAAPPPGNPPAAPQVIIPNVITPTNWDHSAAVEARAEQILAQMTLAQKVDLATGQINNSFGFYNNPIPQVGIPAQTMADGPVGVRVANPAATNGGKTTQLPSASALAATFDPALARQYGALIGQEAFRSGNNMSLAPSADTARTPLWGRAFEGFGEDPLLTGTLDGTYIQGVQSNSGVGATIKHFLVYNQETDRFNVNAVVSDRALHEIYNRAFQIGIASGHPAAAMCSFNQINGVPACGNSLMTSLLKGVDGFRGFVMSDYNATPDTNNAANSGLDQNQPGDQGPGTANFGDRLVAAVNSGQVPISRVNDMALRILRGMVGLGLLDHPAQVQDLNIAGDAAVARSVAAQAMVLLKNSKAALPLTTGRADKSIAVIGGDADNISAQGGGSSEVSRPTSTISPLAGITARAGAGTTVTYQPGTDGVSEGTLLPGPAAIPSTVLTPAGGSATDHGLSAQYWSNASFSGTPHLSQIDPQVNTDFGFQNFPGFNAASPKAHSPSGDFALTGDLSARWTGTFTAPATGTYQLGLTARGNATLTLDGATFLTHTGGLTSISRSVHLVAGQHHSLAVSYNAPAANAYQGGQVRLFWTHPDSVMSPAMQAAVASAKKASTAVVVVRDYETEGVDRPNLDLPNEQDQLIRQVAKVNPHTVVVIETGAPATMSTWDAGVSAVVQAWYPGQEQGAAIADVLFGDVNPAGHLPVTAPRNTAQVPVPTVGTTNLSEGIYVGYRGYQHNAEQIEYPFGYGLSYTTFAESNLHTTVTNGTQVQATFTVTNTGKVAGAAVPQVYVGTLPSKLVDTPPRQLAGWDKIILQPGQAKTVSVTVNKQSMSYWDSYANRWITPSGNLKIIVGNSATNTAVSSTVQVRSTDVEGAGQISQAKTYSIQNSATSKCLDAKDHGTANGTPVQMYACPAPGRNQRWTFTSTSGGFYTIGNVEAADKVLDVTGGPGATADGVKLQLWSDVGGSNQQFKPVRIGDGNYQLIALHSGKCLGVTGGSTANGALLEQQTCDTANTDQSFKLLAQPTS